MPYLSIKKSINQSINQSINIDDMVRSWKSEVCPLKLIICGPPQNNLGSRPQVWETLVYLTDWLLLPLSCNVRGPTRCFVAMPASRVLGQRGWLLKVVCIMGRWWLYGQQSAQGHHTRMLSFLPGPTSSLRFWNDQPQFLGGSVWSKKCCKAEENNFVHKLPRYAPWFVLLWTQQKSNIESG